MNAKTIQKYKDYTIARLLKLAEKHFNEFIRYRDTDANGYGRCISSGKWLRIPSRNAHAGHFYSAGKYPLLRFNENNVNLQGKSDNYYNGGNENEYRKALIKKIGVQEVEKLDLISSDKLNKTGFKWDRFTLIDIIETYKIKAKQLKKTKNF